MNRIEVLDQNTIDKIAAGEVVERPASVAKELMENAIDSGANAITVEIRGGGIEFIRITDNGCGIAPDQVRTAFLRHATSKLRTITELSGISSLGFRGEALSSIAAVSRVELITRPRDSITGVRYVIEGGIEKSFEEIGAPYGTTFLMRHLFFNTPARAKFLKSPTAEANAVGAYVEQLALSHPDISFKYMVNGSTKLYTSGNGNLKEAAFQIYGKEAVRSLIPIEAKTELLSVSGYLGTAEIARGSRSFEIYFVNGRYVRNKILSKAIEDGYQGHLMQHRYPFTILNLDIRKEKVDVNVHPAKLEVRFSDQEAIYRQLQEAVAETLHDFERIPAMKLDGGRRAGAQKPVQSAETAQVPAARIPGQEGLPQATTSKLPEQEGIAQAPSAFSEKQKLSVEMSKRETSEEISKQELFEHTPGTQKSDCRIPGKHQQAPAAQSQERVHAAPEEKIEGYVNPGSRSAKSTGINKPDETAPNHERGPAISDSVNPQNNIQSLSRPDSKKPETPPEPFETNRLGSMPRVPELVAERQLSFLDNSRITPETMKKHRFIGQVFGTYLLVEMEGTFYIIDQHAAHEKVLFERLTAAARGRDVYSQMLMPPIVLSLTMKDASVLSDHLETFTEFGFEIEAFGGREFKISAVPADLYGVDVKGLFLEILDNLEEPSAGEPKLLLERIASRSCKAAIKANQRLSVSEAEKLLEELFQLSDPYHCPHGRPTMISLSRYELDRKFKRIV